MLIICERQCERQIAHRKQGFSAQMMQLDVVCCALENWSNFVKIGIPIRPNFPPPLRRNQPPSAPSARTQSSTEVFVSCLCTVPKWRLRQPSWQILWWPPTGVTHPAMRFLLPMMEFQPRLSNRVINLSVSWELCQPGASNFRHEGAGPRYFGVRAEGNPRSSSRENIRINRY